MATVFRSRVEIDRLAPLLTAFDNGLSIVISDQADAFSYIHQVSAVDGLSRVISDLVDGRREPEVTASAVEFVLEGLHQSRKVSRRARAGSGIRYSR